MPTDVACFGGSERGSERAITAKYQVSCVRRGLFWVISLGGSGESPGGSTGVPWGFHGGSTLFCRVVPGGFRGVPGGSMGFRMEPPGGFHFWHLEKYVGKHSIFAMAEGGSTWTSTFWESKKSQKIWTSIVLLKF